MEQVELLDLDTGDVQAAPRLLLGRPRRLAQRLLLVGDGHGAPGQVHDGGELVPGGGTHHVEDQRVGLALGQAQRAARHLAVQAR